MPALAYPDQATEVDVWNVREAGVRDGSSSTERLEVDASSVEREYLVDWAYRYDFAWLMVGYAETWDNAGTTTLSRLLPRDHPQLPHLVATKITSITGHKWTGISNPPDADGYDTDDERNHGHPAYQWKLAGNVVNVYQDARVKVLFEHVPYALKEDADTTLETERYISIDDPEPAAEYLQLPTASFKYLVSGGGGAPHNTSVPFNSGKVVPSELFRVTWHRLPEDVWQPGSVIQERVYGDGTSVPYFGTVNKTELFGRPAGTMLLSNVFPKRKRSPLGFGFEWDITFEWTYKPNGHNNLYYFDSTTGGASGWYYVGRNGSSYAAPGSVADDDSIYNEREHANLFVVE